MIAVRWAGRQARYAHRAAVVTDGTRERAARMTSFHLITHRF